MRGISAPLEIETDRWGVPHMYASTLYDVFRVQGFNAARDRLWQLDFWRRRGLGLLAEVFGPSMVERDRASRLFYYRGDMQPEWLSYGSDTKRVATAFVEGVNAWIRLALQDRELLPLEFRQLGYEPALWAAEDFARIRSNGLYYNLDSEVARALILRDYDPRVEELRRRLPGEGLTPAELRARSWWSGPEVVVLVDDLELLGGDGGSPLAPLLPYLPQARDLGLHVVAARHSGGGGRALFEPFPAAAPGARGHRAGPARGPAGGAAVAGRVPVAAATGAGAAGPPGPASDPRPGRLSARRHLNGRT